MWEYVLEIKKGGLVRLSHWFAGPEIEVGPGDSNDCRPPADLFRDCESISIRAESKCVRVFACESVGAGPAAPLGEYGFDEWFANSGCYLRVRAIRSTVSRIVDDVYGAPHWVWPELKIRSISQEHTLPFPPSGDELSIGHDTSKATIAILDDPRISGVHLRLLRDVNGNPIVEDIRSLHGTYVNNCRIDEPYRLNHGDCIRLGGTTIDYTCYAEFIGLSFGSKEDDDFQSSISHLDSELDDEDAPVRKVPIRHDDFSEPAELPAFESGGRIDLDDCCEDSAIVRLFSIERFGGVLTITTVSLMCLLAWITAILMS